MNNPTLTEAIAILEKYFSIFNEKYFENELSKPVITISPDTTRRGAYGWCTTWKAWKDSDSQNEHDGHYEINICADSLNRPIEDTAETLLHEMVHLYNLENGVNDCSRSGTYHNTRFRDAAKEHGLNVEKNETYGWSETSLNDDAKKFVKSFNDSSFMLYRTRTRKNSNPQKANTSARKYVCPICECIIRSTREVHVICGECGVPFQLAKK